MNLRKNSKISGGKINERAVSPLNKHTHRSGCFSELNRLVTMRPVQRSSKQTVIRIALLNSDCKNNTFFSIMQVILKKNAFKFSFFLCFFLQIWDFFCIFAPLNYHTAAMPGKTIFAFCMGRVSETDARLW